MGTFHPLPTPVSEPENTNHSLCPPTERNNLVNLKYSKEFDCPAFTGTAEKLNYIVDFDNSTEPPRKRKKQRWTRKRKLSQTRYLKNGDDNLLTRERLLEGSCGDHIKLYGLEENSHAMDWFASIMPMTQKDNKYNANVANVKGDVMTKFSVSNWAAYSNTKVMMANVSANGHVFERKSKISKLHDIMKMLGVYILDSLMPLPQLHQKMQPQSKEKTHVNNFIAFCIGTLGDMN